MTSRALSLPRSTVVALTAVAVLAPVLLIFWQSFLNAPFFNPAHKFGLASYAFIFDDPDFWSALFNSVVIATGMAVIALPLGAALAFLLTRTDLPWQRTIEVLVLVPVFVSPMVLAFGYVVAMGPVGFYSLWAKDIVGDVPWNVYSLFSIAVIAGLTHVRTCTSTRRRR
jgi:iron(III) transport system permease protein